MELTDRIPLLVSAILDAYDELESQLDFIGSSVYDDMPRARSVDQPLPGGRYLALVGPAPQSPSRPTPESSVAGVLVYWGWVLSGYLGRDPHSAGNFVVASVQRARGTAYLPAFEELRQDLQALRDRLDKAAGRFEPAIPCQNPECRADTMKTYQGVMCPVCGLDQTWESYCSSIVAQVSA